MNRKVSIFSIYLYAVYIVCPVFMILMGYSLPTLPWHFDGIPFGVLNVIVITWGLSLAVGAVYMFVYLIKELKKKIFMNGGVLIFLWALSFMQFACSVFMYFWDYSLQHGGFHAS